MPNSVGADRDKGKGTQICDEGSGRWRRTTVSRGRLVVAEVARWSEVATVGSGGCVCVCEGKAKMRGFYAINRGNVATLGPNVATFQREEQPTLRRWDPTSRRSRGWNYQRRDVSTSRHCYVATLRANVATLHRRPKCKLFTRF